MTLLSCILADDTLPHWSLLSRTLPYLTLSNTFEMINTAIKAFVLFHPAVILNSHMDYDVHFHLLGGVKC